MKYVAIIPARGGSKRILKKNIKEFDGKPIIAYSILAALKSKLFEKVVVSTDSNEIAEISKQFGAEIPFIRNKELSDDFAIIHDVISDAIFNLEDNNFKFEYACCIYATAPFLNENDLKMGFEIVHQNKNKIAFAASKYSYPVQRSFFINDQNHVEMLFPDEYKSRSQDLKEIFHDAGQFSWAHTDIWKSSPVPFGKNHSPVIIPAWRVQDIDNIEDWDRAELISKLTKED